MSRPFTQVTSRAVVLPRPDVDTDQIIPAEHLKGTTRTGLGAALFAGWRSDATGAPRPDFVLNQPAARGAEILVAGPNFGCGSSREHAVWALADFGFRAVISPRFADIFRGNATKNGLVPAEIAPASAASLETFLSASPEAQITVDLEASEVRWGEAGRASFAIDPFARHCLLAGQDSLDLLLSAREEIAAFAAHHPFPLDTRRGGIG